MGFFYITVPNTTSDNASMLVLRPGTDVHLSCTSVGAPQALLSWFRDGIAIMNGSGGVLITATDDTSELVVTDSMGRQGGEYNCSGSNIVGRSSVVFIVECKFKVCCRTSPSTFNYNMPCLFLFEGTLVMLSKCSMLFHYKMLYFPDFPEAVMELQEISTTFEAIYIEWMYQMNGSSPRTGVEIEVRRNDTLEKTIMIGPAQATATISTLLSLSTYDITVFVVSDVGRSRPSSINASTLSLSM